MDPVLEQAINSAGGSRAGLLKQIASIESGGKVNGPDSAAGAAGPFQFTAGTAAAYGLTDPHDPVAATKAAANLLDSNAAHLNKVLGRDPTDGEQYLAYQQGASGASALLTQPGLNVVDALAVAYGGDKDKAKKAVTMNGGSADMTAGEFANKWTSKFGMPVTPAAQDVAPTIPGPDTSVPNVEQPALPGEQIKAPNYIVPGGDPTDTQHWTMPSELIGPDTPDQPMDPIAANREQVDALKPQETLNEIGGTTGYEESLGTQEAHNTSFWKQTGMAFRNFNAAVGLWNYAEQKNTFPADPNFDWKGYQQEWQKTVPPYYWHEYADVRSKAEADAVSGQIQQELTEQSMLARSAKGMTAIGLASIFDLDIALQIASGGEGEVAKAGILAMRLSRMGRYARMGMAAGALDEGVIAATHPTGDYHNMVTGALTGAVFGAGLGMFGREEARANASVNDALKDFDKNYREGNIDLGVINKTYNPEGEHTNWYVDGEGRAMTPEDSMKASVEGKPEEGSVGAAARPRPGVPPGMTGPAADAVAAAAAWRHNFGWSQAIQAATKNPRVAKLIELMNKIPGVKTDWEALRDSPSAIVNKLSYDLLESAEGTLVNNTSAAMVKDMYMRRSMQWLNDKEAAFQAWATNRGVGLVGRHWSTDARKAFDKELLTELEARRVGEPPTHDPHVGGAADAWQKMADETHLQRKGRAGERPVKGYENMPDKPEPGYFTRIWRGDKVRAKIAQIGRKQLVKDIANNLGPSFQGLTNAEKKEVAKAIIGRALSKDSEVDSSLIALLSEDGSQKLRDELVHRGVAADEADRIVQILKGPIEEKGVSGRNKGRIDMDLRGRLSDGSQLLDLVENDTSYLYQHYVRATAGEAALARKGIASAGEVRDIINHALSEQEALGLHKGDKGYVSRDTLDTVFTYFGAGPIAKGIHPLVRMMTQVTNLALLGQLGLTQMAETGAMIGAVGFKRWLEVATPVVKDLFNNPGSRTSQMVFKELEPLTGKIGDAHNVFRDDILLDEMRANPSAATDFLGKADKLINKLRRIQGFTSLFYQVQSAQHKIATELMIHKVVRGLVSMPALGADELAALHARLASIGISGRSMQRIQDMIDKHVVFGPDGNVSMLNIDKWDYHAQQDFILAMNRSAYQQVQKAMAGEEASWMHKETGAVFMHLKTFPFVAMKKQFARHARFMDAETMGVFWYGLGTAGVVYATKQALNGNTERLNPGDVALGAFNLSNMTGWIPSWTDPVFTMLGMNSGRMSQYGYAGVNTGILSTPPLVPTINKLLHLPQALKPDGKLSHQDTAVLRSIPIVGNAYGVSGILNALGH